ncbi:MAG: hypothetical protein B6D41_04065, partial [Chloroflexi bacterium UTCFX4]
MTELIWEGKYIDGGDGKASRKAAPLRVALPFQTVETVNESAQLRQRTLDLFSAGRDAEWRNRLIWGDKKYVLPSLLPEFAGKVNLIYIDPPFNVGADFSFTATIPDNPDTDDDETTSFVKAPSVIEMKAYRDTWGRGLDSYLQWFYETAILLRELLAEDGSIYVHLDYHVAHYAKLVLDEVFGVTNFVNEIVWRRAFAHNDPARCGMIHDNIYFYCKGEKYTWNKVFQKPSRDYIEQFFDQYDEKRKERYARLPLDAPRHGDGGNLLYEWKGVYPSKNRTWAYVKEKMEEFDKAGRIHYPKNGMPRLKRYESEYEGTVIQDIWTDVNKIHNQSPEQLHYPTQKPEALLERIIRASSNENDLVLDCFCGSGTTAAVAEKLNRRWITADLGRFAIHTTRKRLLSIENVRPFVVQNLGKYERQVWQAAEFANGLGDKKPSLTDKRIQADMQQAYRDFILKLYNARGITGYVWLHGLKNGRLVHVGAVDSPVSVGDVKNIVAEFKRAVGTGKDAPATNGVDVLGWDFAFELNEVAIQQAAQANVNVKFLRIPREVLEKKAVEQGDIRFFELAALKVKVDVGKKSLGSAMSTSRKTPKVSDAGDAKKPLGFPKTPKVSDARAVMLMLEDFVIPPDDVPADVQRAIKHWSQWIDYWAVDWDNKGDAFHNEWQTYRTRKNPELQKSAAHTYDAA